MNRKNRRDLLQALRVVFVSTLKSHGKVYHFDDDASEIIEIKSGKRTFTDKQARALNMIVQALGDDDANERLHRLALKAIGA